jgi:NadR type nicotinamide-nucleotide adenylyltransferase
MTKRFSTGLVVGKFAPLHLGHEHVIRTALEQCERVLLISYSRPEMPHCPPERRQQWLTARFPECESLVVTQERVHIWQSQGLGIAPLPDNDADDETHRSFVAQLCLQVLGTTVDAVFTSEDYGDGFAGSLSRHFGRPSSNPVRHICVDRARTHIPVSGTVIRDNPHAHRHLMAPKVYADFVERICLLGGESSGKTTMTHTLAEALGTLAVEEYGREYWVRQGGTLVFEDMLHIAETQIAREQEGAEEANRFLVCDTSPLTTWLYSRHLFGRTDPRLDALASRPYAHTFLCVPDYPFVQDGTRAGDRFRLQQHQWYLAELQRRKISYTLLTGSIGERIATALAHIRGGDEQCDQIQKLQSRSAAHVDNPSAQLDNRGTGGSGIDLFS